MASPATASPRLCRLSASPPLLSLRTPSPTPAPGPALARAATAASGPGGRSAAGPRRPPHRRRAALALLGLVLLGCKDPGPDSPEPASAAANLSAQGEALYTELCSVCHGAAGQGITGPKLRDWQRGADELTRIIHERMPPGRPDRCTGRCPERIAAYILSGFAPAAPQCDDSAGNPGPRQLRLLTRREYQNTVSTLLGLPPPQTCPPPSFVYAPGARTLRSVHVAGSFNGWPKTIADGGFPLTYAADRKQWSLSQKLPVGTHTYKLVLDESEWLTDPANPNTQPDGFGGQNSVLTVSCEAGTPPADPTANLPADSRPEDFPFDDHAQARIVTSVHAEEYRKTARLLAERAAANLPALVPCDPSGTNAAACAEQFIQSFGLRAVRRPLTPQEVQRYKTLLLGRKTFTDGVKAVVAAPLQSPGFLYRSELGDLKPDGTYRLNGYEIAGALSYLFWGTMPDAALFTAAAAGKLSEPAEIAAQAQRLVADPRSRPQLAAFAMQWLGADAILTSAKSPDLFPEFTASVRADMVAETQKFVTTVAFDKSGSLDELWTADYSFVNESLARIYGIAGVTGPLLQQKTYAQPSRAGLLGHGSVLGSSAYSDQTSPIRRGVLIRRRLLCQELPVPPPGAGGVPKVNPAATTRERFRQHSDNPFCHSCHGLIDDVGFGLERFSPIGGYRDHENGLPIDDSGNLNDREALGSGTSAPYQGGAALGQNLAQSPRAQACFVRQYLRFARGYNEDVAEDLCTLQRLVKRFQASGRRIPDLMVAVTASPDFVTRR